MQKKVLAIHDISCLGRCSLTAAIPIISVSGAEVVPLPTAVLSTHTGGFLDFAFRDLTADMRSIADHWKKLGVRFDVIYTGYLGSLEQVTIVKEIIRDFSSADTLVVVDPVMADAGEYYSLITPDFAIGMRELCEMADIIMPNMTEAAFLLGEEYVEHRTQNEVETILRKLARLGPKKIVLSGVSSEDCSMIGAAAYDAFSDEISYTLAEKIEGFYHGTGDTFASALIAALTRNMKINEATKVAVEYTLACIRRTHTEGTDTRYGVDIENEFPTLMRLLGMI
ncbi:MAG: pyridoxamine kinase [Clostridia bacterium]|nr:pyridoxamine kinase [Clostridia bacterium]